MTLAQGQVIDGKYRIVRMIGEGGMGAVYEGENVRIRRRVAIKVLHAGVASNTEMVQRFEREAQVAGTVGNDHILEILDLGALDGGERYMVMEFLDGETLTDRIKSRGRLPPAEAASLIRQVLRGLSAAHAAGIVHRDLKPDNIFILKEKAGTRDYVKIIDFGISKFAEQATSTRMTRTGALMGTPHYMAPEQATGSSEIDRRTDIYAVGIILYEAVTGRVPFQAETFNQLLFEIALAKIMPASQLVRDLDPAIDSIIMKASARDPVHRFQTCDEFMAALDEWRNTGRSVSVPPEQSIEAIVAATVPRTGAMPVTAGDSGLGMSAARSASGSNPGIGHGSVARAPAPSVPGVPTGSVAGGRPPSVAGVASGYAQSPSVSDLSAADGLPQPTLNSWANSQAGIPKSGGAMVVVATLAGVLLLAGGGFAAYSLLKPSAPSPAASVAPPGTTATAVAQKEPDPVVSPADPAPPPSAASAADVAATPPSVAPAAPAAAARAPARSPTKVAAARAQAKAPPSKPAKPEPEKPAAATAPAKTKKPINFGY